MNMTEFVNTRGRPLRQMFYLLLPSELSYPSVEAVPQLVDETIPWFFLFIMLEMLYCWKKGWKRVYSIDDSITSLGAGALQTAVVVAIRTAELSLYCWVHEHFCIYELPWDSPWTWLLTFVAVDFLYYWFHRAGHEINVIWALHQTHHSSEYYNYTTALRQGMFQNLASMFFYLPEALLIPPQVHLVHATLSLLYQFWIHTQVIGTLGPLEKFINTPSSHRVHHGRNRYCIDKNYGGVLIIWDRIFGTYQSELNSEPIAYGLVDLVNSFDAFYLQLFYLKYALWDKPTSMTGIRNKLKAIFYGPGWFPGTGRCGNLEDIPDIKQPMKPYNSGVQIWISIYVLVHFVFMVLGYQMVASQLEHVSWHTRFTLAFIMMASVQIFGMLLEKKPSAPFMEILRCFLMLFYWFPLIDAGGNSFVIIAQIITATSAAIWAPSTILTIIERNGKMKGA